MNYFIALSFITILGIFGAASPRAAEMTPPSEKTAQVPLEISADEALEWQRDAHQYIARGNVVARQGDMTLTADELAADYRDQKQEAAAAAAAEKTSGPDIYRLTATGHVTIKTATETATGTRAIYNHDESTAVLEGPVTITRGRDILTGARATVDLASGKSTLVGGGKGSKTRVTGVFYTSKNKAKEDY